MARLTAVTKENAGAKARGILDTVEKSLGRVPNMMATMANSAAVLDAYLSFSTALQRGTLSAKLREQLALAVGETNQCHYCVSAHTALGRLAGLSADEVEAARCGSASDAKTTAVLGFAQKIVSDRGHVSDEAVDALRTAGFDDGPIAEIVAVVALNLFTNYFNHVAQTDLDFPAARNLDRVPACACTA